MQPDGSRSKQEPTVSDVSGIVASWVHGWAVSRALPSPTSLPGGWRIQVGLPGHRVRYVLANFDNASLTELGRRHTEPGTWIKAATNPTDLHRVLPARWTMSDTGHLMTAPFTLGVPVLPTSYTTQLEVRDDVIVASVLDATGETAACGRLAPTGSVGVIDQVETAPAHSRRGLASAVMRTLAHHAARRGMHSGVLVATDDGRELYRTLGWTVRSLIAAAHIPEAPPPFT